MKGLKSFLLKSFLVISSIIFAIILVEIILRFTPYKYRLKPVDYEEYREAIKKQKGYYIHIVNPDTT